MQRAGFLKSLDTSVQCQHSSTRWCAHIIPGPSSASAVQRLLLLLRSSKGRGQNMWQWAGACFFLSLSTGKRLGGREQILDSASKCHSISLQILHVFAPRCCAVLALCGVARACLEPGLFLSLEHVEFCCAPMALNTSGFSIWCRETWLLGGEYT